MRAWKEQGEPVGNTLGEPVGPMGWDEVEDVLAGKHRMAKRPEGPKPSPEPCPLCAQLMKPLYFANSDECWKALCGRAHWVLICPDCRAWSEPYGYLLMG